MQTALVVDKNNTVLSILKKWLHLLDFKDVKTCNSAKKGLEYLKTMKDDDTIPIVFLGYDLSDMNCLQFIKEALTIITDVIIVVETTHSISEPFIKDLFANGVFHYVQKPIRFAKLSEVVNVIKEESELLNSGFDSSYTELELLLKKSQKMSVSKIQELLAIPQNKLVFMLKKLIENNKAKEIGTINEVACNTCKSIMISACYCCPQCQSNNFESESILEHYKCGNVGPTSDYEDDTCPKCKKLLKEFGLDYRTSTKFICSDCKNVFENLLTFFSCGSCGGKFQINEAGWKKSKLFISMLTTNKTSNTVTEFEQLDDIAVVP